MDDLRIFEGRRSMRATSPRLGARILLGMIYVVWQLARIAVCAVLVLLEPIVRAILVPLAFLGFLVTLIFGFLIGDPRFPRWGMLAFSVGSIMLYWLYLGLMSLFMTLPPGHDDRRR